MLVAQNFGIILGMNAGKACRMRMARYVRRLIMPLCVANLSAIWRQCFLVPILVMLAGRCAATGIVQGFEDVPLGEVSIGGLQGLVIPDYYQDAGFYEGKVVAHDGTFDYTGPFAPPFASAGDHFLSVRNAFSYPCSFLLSSDQTGIDLAEGKSCTVDFMAKFTAFEFEDSPPDVQIRSRGGFRNIHITARPGFAFSVDDGIWLWQEEIADETAYYEDGTLLGTNWFVRVGNGSGGSVDCQLEAVGAVPLPKSEGWHRLTFKVFRPVGSESLVFNVFIDGVQARSGETSDFRSRSSATSINHLYFIGQGCIDNVVAEDASPLEPFSPASPHFSDFASWAERNGLVAPSSSADEIAAAATASGPRGPVWQDFVTGADPNAATNEFRAVISMENGAAKLSWTPKLSAADEAKRDYTVYASDELGKPFDVWEALSPEADLTPYRFFRIGVEMK